MAVRALQEDALAVEVEPAVLRLDRADAEAGGEGEAVGLPQGDGVEAGGIRRPEAEARHRDGRAAAPEGGGERVRAVEDERRVEVRRLEVDGLDLDRPRPVVARPHEELPVVERERDAVEEATPAVEVVVRAHELLVAPVEAVVHGGEERVFAGGERTRRDLDAAPGQRVRPDVAPVDPERAVEPQPVHDEPGVLHRRVERERAAVVARPPLHEPLRQRVEAARHHDAVRRGERRVRLLPALPLLEAELPGPVEVQRLRRGHHSNGRHQHNSQDCRLHHAVLLSFLWNADRRRDTQNWATTDVATTAPAGPTPQSVVARFAWIITHKADLAEKALWRRPRRGRRSHMPFRRIPRMRSICVLQ